MRFKADENVPSLVIGAFEGAGYDVRTAREEELSGAPDDDIARAARSEGRCLLTLDLDFADPRQYPPADQTGIVVFRPRRASPSILSLLANGVLDLLQREPVAGRLWIAEAGRVRVHEG